ncbi:MAG: hypothetical protein CW338_10930, partial [Clostridiales bacterium]|nr:hypothetical protein [Clostridiales bacterium]
MTDRQTGSHRPECVVRRAGDAGSLYTDAAFAGLDISCGKVSENGISTVYRVSVTNISGRDFSGVIHFRVSADAKEPGFFMPGYMYNRNTAGMPSSGRKAFPRIRKGGSRMPESEYFMTRSDRLAEPVSLICDDGRVLGVSAAPYIRDEKGAFRQFCGFSCSINDGGRASAGYTLGWENAPWLFVQTATVREREPVTDVNSFQLKAGETFAFELTVYDYAAEDERGIYRAIEDVYWKYHESPRRVPGMDEKRALELLTSAVRDYAWLPQERIYTGFVYDRPEGLAYNRIPSLSWTNGLAVAVPVLMAAEELGDEKAGEQSLTFIEDTVRNSLNPRSGFLFESAEDGKPSVRGWWYDGMHSGGHSGYINGQAVYYILQAYRAEKEKRGIVHEEWSGLAEKVVRRMNEEINSDLEYPFAMSADTGAGIEYDALGSCWCLAASALYVQLSGDRTLLDLLMRSERHYFAKFVQRAECYGGPLDTDKAVDDEGILAFIRAARLLHELTGEEYLLDHLRDALNYEFSFKLGWNTPVQVRPLSTIG